MKRYPVALAAMLLLLLPGCGSITRGSTQAWVVETDPPGAGVRLSSGQTCTTPCSLELPRKNNFVVTINREGHEPVTANVTSGTSGGGAASMAGNLLFGGLIGLAVDAGTGANKDLSPNPLRVTLVPLSPPAIPPAPLPEYAPPAAAPAPAAGPPPVALVPGRTYRWWELPSGPGEPES